jgi:hypothetical protein
MGGLDALYQTNQTGVHRSLVWHQCRLTAVLDPGSRTVLSFPNTYFNILHLTQLHDERPSVSLM